MNLGGVEQLRCFHKMHREIVVTAVPYFLGGTLALCLATPGLARTRKNGWKRTNSPFKSRSDVGEERQAPGGPCRRGKPTCANVNFTTFEIFNRDCQRRKARLTPSSLKIGEREAVTSFIIHPRLQAAAGRGAVRRCLCRLRRTLKSQPFNSMQRCALWSGGGEGRQPVKWRVLFCSAFFFGFCLFVCFSFV